MRAWECAMRAPLAVCLALVLGCSPEPAEEVATEAPPPRPEAIAEELPNFDPSRIDTRFVCEEYGLQTADGENIPGQYETISDYLLGSNFFEKSRPPGMEARMRRVGEVYIAYAVHVDNPEGYTTRSLLDETIDLTVKDVSVFEALSLLVTAVNESEAMPEGLSINVFDVAAAQSEEEFLLQKPVSFDMRGRTVREVLCAIIEKSPVAIRYVYGHSGGSPMDKVRIDFPLIPVERTSADPHAPFMTRELYAKVQEWQKRVETLNETGRQRYTEIIEARREAKAAAEAAEAGEAP